MKWKLTAGCLSILIGMLALSACTGEEPANPTSCTPGQQTTCGCPDGSQSIQQCNDDGTYGPCDCPELDAGTADPDVPDSDDSGLDASEDTGGTDAADSGSQDTTEQDTTQQDAGGQDVGEPDAGDDTIACSEIPQAGSRDMRWTEFTDPNFSFYASDDECDPFPGPGCNVYWKVENNHFLAVEFEAPSYDPDAPDTANTGYLVTSTDSHALNGKHTLSFSHCPGDFSEALPEGKCRATSASHSFWWSVMGEHYDVACELEPGETYYLNFIYARGADLEDQTCDSDNEECGALYQPAN